MNAHVNEETIVLFEEKLGGHEVWELYQEIEKRLHSYYNEVQRNKPRYSLSIWFCYNQNVIKKKEWMRLCRLLYLKYDVRLTTIWGWIWIRKMPQREPSFEEEDMIFDYIQEIKTL